MDYITMATKEKIFERNPDTGVIRWRYVDESLISLAGLTMVEY